MAKARLAHIFKDGVEYKKCSKCAEWNPISDFCTNKQAWDLVNSSCKACQSVVFKSFYVKQGIKLNRRPKTYKHKFDEVTGLELKRCSKCTEWKPVEANFVLNKGLSDGYSGWCKLCISTFQKKRRETDSIRVRSQESAYYQRHFESRRDYQNKKNALNYTDSQFRLAKLISNRMWQCLKAQKGNISYKQFLPYTLQELMLHLEIQFDNKMSWDNYGSAWSVDHILPIVSFCFRTAEDEDFKRCWALENLRPLSVGENKAKRDRILPADELLEILTKARDAANIIYEKRKFKCR